MPTQQTAGGQSSERASNARWKLRLAALASGLLLAASRPSLDIGGLSLVGLVPLLIAVRGQRVRTAASLGLIAGCAYYGVVVSWAWYFGAVALFPFVLVLAVYWAAALAAITWLRNQGWVSPIVVALTWILFENALARWPLGGFSWGELGYAAHNIAPLRNLASLGGVSLVSGYIVAVNALIANAVCGLRSRNPACKRAWQMSLTAAGLAALVVVWNVAAPSTTPTGTLRVAALQGNNINRDLTPSEIGALTLANNHFRLADTVADPVDLIVFPESAMHPESIDNPVIQSRLVRVARDHNSYVLANGIHELPDGRVKNRNIVVMPDGRIAGTYDKRHLVPFGEYVPWRATLTKLIDALKRIPRDFVPGTNQGRFELRGHVVSQVICFESAFGYAVRDDVRAGAELIVVSTNNRSYRRSANSAQHIAIAQLRAVETGREIIHASVSGVSAHIDAKGEVVQHSQMFVNGILRSNVTTRRGSTIYVRLGDWPLLLAGCTVLALCIIEAIRARRRRGARASGSTSST